MVFIRQRRQILTYKDGEWVNAGLPFATLDQPQNNVCKAAEQYLFCRVHSADADASVNEMKKKYLTNSRHICDIFGLFWHV